MVRRSSASDKAKLFAENFSKNSILDDSGVSLPVSPIRTNLKVHNISVTPKMVKKVIMNLGLSKASGPDCIPVVVLKNCEPELSYILAEPFNKCLKEPCFPDCWKLSLVVPVFKNVGERSTAKHYHPASLLSVVMNKTLYIFLDNNNIIYNLTFGFTKQYPISYALINITENVRKALDDGNIACGVFKTYIQKFFDTVDHQILLVKLNHYWICGVLHDWFKPYLSNFNQYIHIQKWI